MSRLYQTTKRSLLRSGKPAVKYWKQISPCKVTLLDWRAAGMRQLAVGHQDGGRRPLNERRALLPEAVVYRLLHEQPPLRPVNSLLVTRGELLGTGRFVLSVLTHDRLQSF